MLSEYQYASNRPIDATDLDGLEAVQLSWGGRTTFLLVSVVASVSLVAAQNGNSLYVTPEFGERWGLAVSDGPEITVYFSASNSRDIQGPSVTVGASGAYKAGIGVDYNYYSTGHGIGASIEGAYGVECHFTPGYSFLIGTLDSKDIRKGAESIRKLLTPSVQVSGLLEKIQSVEQAYKRVINDLKPNATASTTQDRSVDESKKSTTSKSSESSAKKNVDSNTKSKSGSTSNEHKKAAKNKEINKQKDSGSKSSSESHSMTNTPQESD